MVYRSELYDYMQFCKQNCTELYNTTYRNQLVSCKSKVAYVHTFWILILETIVSFCKLKDLASLICYIMKTNLK